MAAIFLNLTTLYLPTSVPYIHASDGIGACSGILQSIYYPANVYPLFADAAYQTAVDAKLDAIFASMPKWLTNDCHFAMRKYICSGTYKTAYNSSLLEIFVDNGISPAVATSFDFTPALLAVPVYLPSYPSTDVCNAFATECAVFIAAANNSMLTPDCVITSNDKQTVGGLELSATVLVALKSQPNPSNSSSTNDNNYHPSCPGSGIVVPDTPHDPNARMIPGSACALACMSPLYTVAEFNSFTTTMLITSAVSLVLVLSFLYTWLSDKTRRKQYLVICFASFNVLSTAYNVAVYSHKPEDVFCRNNTSGYNIEIDGVNLCTMQPIVLMYCILGIVLTWMFLAIDLLLKVNFRMTKTERILPFAFACIFSLPLIPVIILAATRNIGFNNGVPFCETQVGTYTNGHLLYDDVVLFFGPVLAIAGVGMCLIYVHYYAILSLLL